MLVNRNTSLIEESKLILKNVSPNVNR